MHCLCRCRSWLFGPLASPAVMIPTRQLEQKVPVKDCPTFRDCPASMGIFGAWKTLAKWKVPPETELGCHHCRLNPRRKIDSMFENASAWGIKTRPISLTPGITRFCGPQWVKQRKLIIRDVQGKQEQEFKAEWHSLKYNPHFVLNLKLMVRSQFVGMRTLDVQNPCKNVSCIYSIHT